MLLSLCTTTFKKGVIAFFDRKQAAHRMYLLMHFLGLRVGELHGNLSQQQRSVAYDNFKSGEIDLLMATDLASRGLDIQVRLAHNTSLRAVIRNLRGCLCSVFGW